MTLLVNLIENILRNRHPTYTSKTKEKTYDHGLPKEEFDRIRRLLYGPGGGAGGGPRMDRFIRSFIQLGYPQAGRDMFIRSKKCMAMILTCEAIALEESLRTARDRGKSIERDSEGLPMNLRLPPKESSVNHSDHTTFLSTRISTPVTSCGSEVDSPPRELLGEVTTLPVTRGTIEQTFDSSGSSSTITEATHCEGKQLAFKGVLHH